MDVEHAIATVLQHSLCHLRIHAMAQTSINICSAGSGLYNCTDSSAVWLCWVCEAQKLGVVTACGHLRVNKLTLTPALPVTQTCRVHETC